MQIFYNLFRRVAMVMLIITSATLSFAQSSTVPEGYFYMRFSDGARTQHYVTDNGTSQALTIEVRHANPVSDENPVASIDNNKLWTWDGDKLKSLTGHYLSMATSGDGFSVTDDATQAVTMSRFYDVEGQLNLVRQSDGLALAKGGNNAGSPVVAGTTGGKDAKIEMLDYSIVENQEYFLRFSGSGSMENNYIKDTGSNKNLQTSAASTNINDLIWQKETTANGFRLKSKQDRYIGWNNSNQRYTVVANAGTAAEFVLEHTATGDVVLHRTGADASIYMSRVNTDNKAGSQISEGGGENIQQCYLELIRNTDAALLGFEQSPTKYFLLMQNNNINSGSRGLIDVGRGLDTDEDLVGIYQNVSEAWMFVGTSDNFVLKNSAGRYISWNAETEHYQTTPVDSRACSFRFVRVANGWNMQRISGSDTKAFVMYNTDNGTYFNEGNVGVDKARVYLMKTTLDNSALDTSTENNVVIHRKSYLAERADALANQGIHFPSEFLQENMGWMTKDNGTNIQNVSEYHMTRYVKRGEFSPLYLSTSNKVSTTKHNRYQRWYLYDTEKPLTTDYFLPEVRGYVYENGWVVGSKVKLSSLGATGHVSASLIARLPINYDGNELVIASDITRYQDFTYENPSASTGNEGGNLTEPSLTLRHIYTLIDANVMARQLTAMTKGGDNWLEEHTIHFPSETIGSSEDFVPLDYELENYWIYKGGEEGEDNLLNLVSNDYVRYEREDHGSGVELLGFQTAPNCNRGQVVQNSTMKRRRLLKFKYPDGWKVPSGSYAVFKVYARDPNTSTEYQLARFTILFDDDSETLYYKDVVGDNAPHSERSTQSLRAMCDNQPPVAHIDFDYPTTYSYQTPTGGGEGISNNNSPIINSSALPLQYSSTNYTYGPVTASWGTYGVAKEATYGFSGHSIAPKMVPVSNYTGDHYSDQYNPGVLYVDASDMPGTVATIKFNGTFCVGSRLMCSGWMASVGGTDNTSSSTTPGGVILSVIGKRGNTETVLYTFCPGMVDNKARRQGSTEFFNYEENNHEVLWHQFYFDFVVSELYDEYELNIENNSYSTEGGDYLLDDVWVFAKLPKVRMAMSSPLCGGELAVMKLETDFESLLSSKGMQEVTGDNPGETDYLSCVFLDRDKFYRLFREQLSIDHNKNYTSIEEFIEHLNAGEFDNPDYFNSYKTAFDQALMKVDVVDNNGQVTGQRVPYGNFEWNTNFSSMQSYTFKKMAQDENLTVFAHTDNGIRKLVFNGTMGINTWEDYKTYTLLTIQPGRRLVDADIPNFALMFNLLDACSNQSNLKLLPKLQIVGHKGQQSLDEFVFCENSIVTFAIKLAGYTFTEDGDETVWVLDDVNFDWWIGTDNNTPGTVEEYKAATNSDGTIRLYDAMKCFRLMNPYATDLYTDIHLGAPELYPDQEFTQAMLDYLRELANPSDGSTPRLILNSKLVDINLSQDYMKIVDETNIEGGINHYVYACAIPIEQQINIGTDNYTFICSEPQPVKIQVSGIAPAIHVGFSEKHYPDDIATLSVRISKKQFEQVHKTGTATPKNLHIPLRGVELANEEEAVGVTMPQELQQRVVLLTGSSDPIMEQYILENYDNLLPPVVGTMTYLKGTPGTTNGDEAECVKFYFNNNFRVREGYSYNLRFPFVEDMKPGSDAESCEGYSEVLLKIVPDYEVWTGEAGNKDWSNDENWRRADFDELYGGNGTLLSANEEDDNYYMTNDVNYVTDEDRQRRKGFAPLYCTEILMMTKEKVDAPLLYDDGDETEKDNQGNPVLDENNNPILTGFPALRSTSSPLIRYDFQAHEWTEERENDAETSQHAKDVRDIGDMVTELYSTNVCDGIVFQSETELVNAHLLNYNKAWVEFALPKNKWHLVSSPLRGTISGEWYAPTWSGRQETTYYEPVTFDGKPVTAITSTSGEYSLNYDRFAPAVYQRQWDKAKAVLYERGAVWSADDASQTQNLGFEGEGDWTPQQGSGQGYVWDSANADEYLNRLVYKPFGDSKINVAVRGSWSGAHNDHTVPYDNGGFSVMPINNLKEHNNEDVKTIFRLPKDDQYYDIWDWGKGYKVERRVRIYIDDGRRDWPTGFAAGEIGTNQNPDDYLPKQGVNIVELKNRGRLRSDYFAEKAVTPEEVTTHIGSTTAGDLALYDLDKDGDINANDVKEAVTPAAVKAHIGSTSAENLALYDRDKNGRIEAADTAYYVTLKNEGKGSMGYFLASNPFVCGLNMKRFFELNADSIYAYYLVMKDSDVDPKDATLTGTYLATQPTGTEWKWTDMSFSGISDGTDLLGRKIVPPRYAFFLKKKEIDGKDLNQLTLRYTPDMMVHTSRDENGKPVGVHPYLSIFAERDGDTSEAMVMMSSDASNKFCPGEDMETFVVSDISSKIPVIYTLTGRLATSVNRIHDFMVLPIGIESNSDKPATVTFQGVENLGDSLMLYDAKTEELLPLKSGMKKQMPGRTQNRFFIVKGENLKEALDESNLQIYVNDGIITVVSATGQPITEIHAYDPSGRQVYTIKPNCAKHRFRLPDGIYVVKANTDDTQQVKKVGN